MIIPFEGIEPRIDPTAWIAPNAVVIGNVEIGEEASVWYGVVVRGDNLDHPIRIGARTNIQDNSVIHVGSRGPATLIGEEVTVGHGVVMEGCIIGKGALVGMNSVVLQEVVIGEAAQVAAGSVVTAGAEVPARHLVAGTPARVKREMDEASLRSLIRINAHYVALSRRHMANDGAILGKPARPRSEGSGG